MSAPEKPKCVASLRLYGDVKCGRTANYTDAKGKPACYTHSQERWEKVHAERVAARKAREARWEADAQQCDAERELKGKLKNFFASYNGALNDVAAEIRDLIKKAGWA